MRSRRAEWLLFPVSFLVTYRLSLWLYWWQERAAYIQAHGGDSASVAYGEGKMDAYALIFTKWPLLLALVCVGVGFAPRARWTAIYGALAAIGAICITIAGHHWIPEGTRAPMSNQIPNLLASAGILTAHYAKVAYAKSRAAT